MKVVIVPVLSDNYSYLIIDENSKCAAAVDPAEAEKVFEAAKKHSVNITHVFTTHHHFDHAGGNNKMKELIPSVQIFGGDDRIEAITSKVKGGDKLKIGDIDVKVHFTPCHTTGHVLYEVSDANDKEDAPSLFTGDTLFIGGCGRFFEGTPDQMYHALIEVITELPKKTKIYCGHEYTVKNLEFAKTLESSNEQIKVKLDWAKKQRENNIPTVPSTVEEELTYNPFMRVREKSIAEAIGLVGASPIQVMKEVRLRKDKF